MKKYAFLVLLTSSSTMVFACDACRKQQSKFLSGLSHGSGPDSNWDYLIVALMSLITIYVLATSIKRLMHPGEQTPEHAKRMIFNSACDER